MDLFTTMRTYAAVVSGGSFTAAADRLGISRALTSKYVSQLEEHLGVRLLNRTTRRMNVTEAGQAYYQRCRQLLDELDELEAAVKDQQGAARGKLTIAAPVAFGELHLTHAVADYLAAQPEVSVDLVLADRYVDIIDEGFDIAVRIGDLADSSLVARHLAPAKIIAGAAPEYLARTGVPQHPEELVAHHCIIDTNFRTAASWPFVQQGKRFNVRVKARFRVNSAIAVREMMLAGQGIGLCPAYLAGEYLKAGRLQEVLPGFATLDYGIYAVYPHHRHLAGKVRSFVDFLVQRFATDPDWVGSRPGEYERQSR